VKVQAFLLWASANLDPEDAEKVWRNLPRFLTQRELDAYRAAQEIRRAEEEPDALEEG